MLLNGSSIAPVSIFAHHPLITESAFRVAADQTGSAMITSGSSASLDREGYRGPILRHADTNLNSNQAAQCLTARRMGRDNTSCSKTAQGIQKVTLRR